MTKFQDESAGPSADQLARTRAAHWHHDDTPLLSLEAVRDWLNAAGLVLYTPRPQATAPAPTLVEATLGKAAPAPDVAAAGTARSLLARLVAEGSAVPLNLMGATGGTGTDVPDYVVSASVFSYIFTLRGNKAWKQPPVTSGAVKVSPLALAAYELLDRKVTLSASELAAQLGKEITEAAVLRALTELWGQLRVLPVPQQDGSATLWELASARFTRQIKSGSNAGQPSALSALISLYLAQALLATEDDIETFLSPLASRSRVRDVVHALLSARQLETVVIGGRTLLHVAGDAPVIVMSADASAKTEHAAARTAEDTGAAGEEPAEGASRIGKFTPKPGGKIGTGFRAKPFSKPGSGKPGFGKPGFARPDRERRPFAGRSVAAGESKPRFDKPWQEKRRPAFEAGGSSPAFGARGKGSGESRPPSRDLTAGAEGERGPRKTFSKPGTFGRKREGFGGGRPPFRSNDARPPRRDFAASAEGPSRPDRAPRPAGGGFKRPGSYTPRPAGDRPAYGGKPAYAQRSGEEARPPFERAGGEGEAQRKVFRKFDAPRGDRPGGGKSGPWKSFGAKPFGNRPVGSSGDRPAQADRPRQGAARPRSADGPRSFDKPRSFDGPRPFSRPDRAAGADRPRAFGQDRPAPRPFPGDRPRRAGEREGGRPAFKGGAGKKPFSAGKTGGFSKPSPFARFADGKKPFRKPGPGRPAPRREGGFTPTVRKRPEEE